MTQEAILVIVILAAMLVGTIFMALISIRRQNEDIDDLDDAYRYLREGYDHVMEELKEVNQKYAKSLDDREKSYNEILVMYKKLEIELDKKDAEIMRLQYKLNNTADILEDLTNEKEEAKKEDC